MGPWSAMSRFEIPSEGNLYLLQVCIGCRVPEHSQHGDNLALVVKSMGYDVQHDKSRTAEFAAPVHGALGQSRVKLLFCEITQISSAGFSYAIFSANQG